MLLLVDLDGVVYRGRTAIPGVAAVLAARARAGDEVVYVTNNSMHYRGDYVARLESMGAPVAPDRVVSSARATALYLVRERPALRRVLVLGGPGLRRELEDVGLEVTDAGATAERIASLRSDARGAGSPAPDALEIAGRPEAVVVGLDPALTYRSLALAADAIRAGALFIATNRDPVFPTEDGLRPGAGSVVAAVETTTGVAPVAIGKPAPLLLAAAAAVAGVRPADAVMVGDSLATDLPAARAVGARCILMLTGVTSAAQVEALAPSDRPDAVARDAAELEAALRRLEADILTGRG